MDTGGGGNIGQNTNINPCVLTPEQLANGNFIPSHVNLEEDDLNNHPGHMPVGINCCDDRYKFLTNCLSINRHGDECYNGNVRIGTSVNGVTPCVITSDHENTIVGSVNPATGTSSSSPATSSSITSSSSTNHENDIKNQANLNLNYFKISNRDDSVFKNVHAEDVLISNSFPGRISSQTVRLISPLVNDVPLKIRSHYIEPKEEVRFRFELISNETVLTTGENIIGKLYFDPVKLCKKSCYTGLPVTPDSLKLFHFDSSNDGLGHSTDGSSGSLNLNLQRPEDISYSRVTPATSSATDSNVPSYFLPLDSPFSSLSSNSHSNLKSDSSPSSSSSSFSSTPSSSPSSSAPLSSSLSKVASTNEMPSKQFTTQNLAEVVSSFWLRGLSLNAESSAIDLNLLLALRDRWSKISTPNNNVLTNGNTPSGDPTSKGENSNLVSESVATNIINATLNLELESGQLLSLHTSARLNWPRLLVSSSNHMKFPLTRFGHSVIREVLIENPTSHPLLIQAVLAPIFFTPEYVSNILRAIGISSSISNEMKNLDRSSFRLIVNDGENEAVHKQFTIPVTPGTQGILLPVGQRARIQIEFAPKWEQQTSHGKAHGQSNVESDFSAKYTSFLLIRNNLTIMEAVKLHGEAGFGLLKIGKELPGLTSMLTFDLQEKHLSKSCNVKSNRASFGPSNGGPGRGAGSSNNAGKVYGDSSSPANSATTGSASEPQFTVHKHFNLVNYGKIPVNVRGFLIGPHVGVSSSSYKSKSTLASLNDQPIGSNKLLEQLIGKVRCQGFGFKVLNCESLSWNISQEADPDSVLVIQPNESKKIHIAFTPDFTVAKTMATLTVITDDGPFPDEIEKNWQQILESELTQPLSWLFKLSTLATFSSSKPQMSKNTFYSYASRTDVPGFAGANGSLNVAIDGGRNGLGIGLITYSLVATVPKSLLTNCDESLPRPYQEMILYYTLVVFMLCLITVTVAFAFIDGTRVLNFTFYPAVLMTRTTSNSGISVGHSASDIYPETFKPFSLKLNENGMIEPDNESVSSTNVSNECKVRKNNSNACLGKKKSSNASASSSSVGSFDSIATNVGNSKNGDAKRTTKSNASKTITKRIRESWNIICQNKLVSSDRRGSNGSSNSSEALTESSALPNDPSKNGKGSKCNLINSTQVSNSKVGKQQASLINVKSNCNESYIKRKLNAKSWFESLASRSQSSGMDKKEEEPVISLPSFDYEFDAEDIQNLKGRKGSKKDKGANQKTKQQPQPQPQQQQQQQQPQQQPAVTSISSTSITSSDSPGQTV